MNLTLIFCLTMCASLSAHLSVRAQSSGGGHFEFSNTSREFTYFPAVNINGPDHPRHITLNDTFTLQPGYYRTGITAAAQAYANAYRSDLPRSVASRVLMNININFDRSVSLLFENNTIGGFGVSAGGSFQRQDPMLSDSRGVTFSDLPFAETLTAGVSGSGFSSDSLASSSASFDGSAFNFSGDFAANASISASWDQSASAVSTSTFGVFGFTITEPTAVTFTGTMDAFRRGSTQQNPFLPDDGPGRFTNVPSGEWFDPPMTSGYDFEMDGSSLFTDILAFPAGIDADDQFEVWVDGVSLGSFGAAEKVDFAALLGAGVSGFRVTGINPEVDGANPLAFPIQLAFNTPTADFTMTPIAVPEPSTALMGAAGFLTILLRGRFRR